MRQKLGRLVVGIAGVILGMTHVVPSIAADPVLPIVFVHGDSDTDGLWIKQIWRFESNGYPRDRLFAVDIPHPSARADNDVEEANRSSAGQAAEAVGALVDQVLAKTGSDKVILIANSRGCQTSRNYVKNRGGAAKVARMVLTGCVHKGVFIAKDAAQGSEYNGAGHFLTALNEEPALPAGIPVTIIRSDRFDLYTQPDARFLGSPGAATGVDYASQEMAGADNITIAGLDHRETGFSAASFAVMYKAITGKEPTTTEVVPETTVALTGKISGYEHNAPTNIPLEGAKVSIYQTDAETGARVGEALFTQTAGADGLFGPATVDPKTPLEFVVEAPGYPVSRIYRSAFPRSSDHVNLRLYPRLPGDKNAVFVRRPRGYFGPDDDVQLNGGPMPGIPTDTPVPHIWQIAVPVADAGDESVTVRFGTETVVGKSSPVADPDLVWLELTD